MKWKLIFLLALSGVVMGFITLYFIPAKYEAVIGTPIFLMCAYFIARYAEVAYFLHGLVLGILNSAIVTVMHASMAGVYMAHHPKDAVQFAKMSAESGASVVQVMLLMGLFFAIISGITMGLFAIAGSKILRSLEGGR